MRWTPRQLAAHLHFLDRDLAIEEAKNLNLMRMAMHSEGKEITDHLATLLPEED